VDIKMGHQPQALKPKTFEGLKKYHLIEITIKENEPVGLKRELSRPPGKGEVFFFPCVRFGLR